MSRIYSKIRRIVLSDSVITAQDAVEILYDSIRERASDGTYLSGDSAIKFGIGMEIFAAVLVRNHEKLNLIFDK